MSENKENFQFPIPNAILEPYIKQAVSTAITAALGDGTKLIESAVHAALAQKVNNDGKLSQYSSDNKYQFVEVIAQNKIREITKEVVVEMAEQMRPKIRKHLEKQILNKHIQLSEAMTDSLIESLKCKWGIEIKFEPPKKD